MSFAIHQENQHFAIAGDMTIYTAQALKEDLLGRMETVDDCEVDLSGVGEIDTAGLQVLLLAKREASARGRRLRFVGHSPAVLEVLDLCNLAAHFGDPLVLISKSDH